MLSNTSHVLNKLKTKIDRLGKDEMLEIFKIIHKNGTRYTHNKNGVFLDLGKVSDRCLIEIRAFIEFIDVNKKHIQEIETKMIENKSTLESTTLKNDFPSETASSANRPPIVITSDYSPFVYNDTVDDGMSGMMVIHETMIGDEELNDEMEEEDDEEEDEIEDTENNEITENTEDNEVSVVVLTIPKKKRAMGICHKIMKKCKNINSIQPDADDIEKDYYEETGNNIELVIEAEW